MHDDGCSSRRRRRGCLRSPNLIVLQHLPHFLTATESLRRTTSIHQNNSPNTTRQPRKNSWSRQSNAEHAIFQLTPTNLRNIAHMGLAGAKHLSDRNFDDTFNKRATPVPPCSPLQWVHEVDALEHFNSVATDLSNHFRPMKPLS